MPCCLLGTRSAVALVADRTETYLIVGRTADLQTGRTMTIMDQATSPDSAPVSSVLPDLRAVPLGEIPPAAVRTTLDRFLSSTETSVSVAAFNSSI
jgi:FXSXX-COOH protein